MEICSLKESYFLAVDAKAHRHSKGVLRDVVHGVDLSDLAIWEVFLAMRNLSKLERSHYMV